MEGEEVVPRLSAHEVTLQFERFTALDGVTFDIPPGDFLGILGPNGSGKTTLLRAFSRALKPSAGAIHLDGAAITSLPPSDLARRMAVVPQFSASGLEYTAGELVRMGRAPYQGRWGGETRRDRAVAEEAMRLTGVESLDGRIASTLSGGELQRVLIARALAQEPSILLLDEPTAHLDLSAQITLLELLHRLNRENGLTLVAVLHDLNLAATYCHRLAMMCRGALVALGTPEEVLTVERIREVYGVEALLRPHPLTRRPMALPVPGPEGAFPEGPRPRVHLVCGGGTGEGLLRALVGRDYPVTAGALNAGDTDHAVAEELGIAVAVAPPFSPLTENAVAEARAMMAAADALLLTDTPFGPGNLANLVALRDAMMTRKPLWIVRPKPEQAWDYTGGAATALRKELDAAGAQSVASPAEALAALIP